MNTDRHSPFNSGSSHHSANARLEEFNKRFDEIKSRFPSRAMFEPNATASAASQQPSMRNDNVIGTGEAAVAGQNVPYSTNIHHQQPNVDPYHNQHKYHQPYDPMNDPRFNFIHDAPQLFRQRFHDTFGGRPGDYFAPTDQFDESSKEHRVHHIPIHIEPRPGSSLGGATSGSRGVSREPSPMPDYNQQQQHSTNPGIVPPPQQFYTQSDVPQQQQQPNVRNVPLQYSAFPHSYHQQQSQQQQPSKNASPKRVVSVPIQICKSSSSPSSTGANQGMPPMKGTTTATQQQASTHQPPINESASDPVIADPNKVYAMSYDPLVQTTNDSKQQDEKLPEVVPLAYEPIITQKQEQTNLQKSQSNENSSTMNVSNGDDNVNICNDPTITQQQQQQTDNEQKPEETPFDYVDEIMSDLRNWEQQVNECQATTADDKGYKWLDEMLTLCVLRLDCINIDGNEELRKYRKNAINEVNRVVALLESKIKPKQDGNSDTANDAQQSDSKNDKNKDKKEKKDGKRLLFFKKKNKDGDDKVTDTDKNNNDLKQTEPEAGTDQQQQSSSTANENKQQTLIGRETEV